MKFVYKNKEYSSVDGVKDAHWGSGSLPYNPAYTLVTKINGSGSKRFVSTASTINLTKYPAFKETFILEGNKKIALWDDSKSTSAWVNSYNFTTTGDHYICYVLKPCTIQAASTGDDWQIGGTYYILPLYMFMDINTQLDVVSWPTKLQGIGSSCFRNSRVLNIPGKFPKSLLTIGNDTFNGATLTPDTGYLDFGPVINSFGKYAFNGQNKTRITYAVIRNTISDTNAQTSYFSSYSRFNNCDFDIVVTENITRICTYLFSYFKGNLYMLGETPPTFSSWGNIGSGLKIYVPIGCGNAYKNAWPNMRNYIYEGTCPYEV